MDELDGDDAQNYPFMLSDGITLYYAAVGVESFGGYDIFVTRYDMDEKKFLYPENLGMPFNSPANDYMLAIDEFNQLRWFFSDRNQTENKVCIYIFIKNDIRKEYEILLNELATFNPEMLDKQRVLAITKCDMLDEELMEMLAENLPENVPHVFISSLTGMGISQLKDILWTELNSESNKLEAVAGERIVHRNKDVRLLQSELQAMGEDEDITYVDEEEVEDLEDYEYEEDWDDEKQ